MCTAIFFRSAVRFERGQRTHWLLSFEIRNTFFFWIWGKLWVVDFCSLRVRKTSFFLRLQHPSQLCKHHRGEKRGKMVSPFSHIFQAKNQQRRNFSIAPLEASKREKGGIFSPSPPTADSQMGLFGRCLLLFPIKVPGGKEQHLLVFFLSRIKIPLFGGRKKRLPWIFAREKNKIESEKKRDTFSKHRFFPFFPFVGAKVGK